MVLGRPGATKKFHLPKGNTKFRVPNATSSNNVNKGFKPLLPLGTASTTPSILSEYKGSSQGSTLNKKKKSFSLVKKPGGYLSQGGSSTLRQASGIEKIKAKKPICSSPKKAKVQKARHEKDDNDDDLNTTIDETPNEDTDIFASDERNDLVISTPHKDSSSLELETNDTSSSCWNPPKGQEEESSDEEEEEVMKKVKKDPPNRSKKRPNTKKKEKKGKKIQKVETEEDEPTEDQEDHIDSPMKLREESLISRAPSVRKPVKEYKIKGKYRKIIDAMEKEREKGTYVECCKCKKWRYLKSILDPSTIPEVWVCSDNPDMRYNSCSIPQVNFNMIPDDEWVENNFTTGSIVWAKIGEKYLWWPAMIDDDPDTGKFCWIEESIGNEPLWYHVLFFNRYEDLVARSWIKTEYIATFEDSSSSYIARMNYHQTQAIEEAHRASRLAIKERRKKYGYIFRYKGFWNLPWDRKLWNRGEGQSASSITSCEESVTDDVHSQKEENPPEVALPLQNESCNSEGDKEKEKSPEAVLPSQNESCNSEVDEEKEKSPKTLPTTDPIKFIFDNRIDIGELSGETEIFEPSTESESLLLNDPSISEE